MCFIVKEKYKSKVKYLVGPTKDIMLFVALSGET